MPSRIFVGETIGTLPYLGTYAWEPKGRRKIANTLTYHMLHHMTVTRHSQLHQDSLEATVMN